MSKGWKEVARLGGQGARYPHLLVDDHGWCLRLGPWKRNDEKYYSNFPSLLQGLIEHFVRRRLKAVDTLKDLDALAGEVRDALRSATELCQTACQTAMDEHMRHLRSRAEPRTASRGQQQAGHCSNRLIERIAGKSPMEA
jgi:hypothetical protein